MCDDVDAYYFFPYQNHVIIFTVGILVNFKKTYVFSKILVLCNCIAVIEP